MGSTFVHLARAPRALWGINISYLLEGLAYFGVLTILGKYLSEDVGMSDFHAGWVYSVFTGGITFSMLVLGGVSDKIGIRRALLIALGLMVCGRTFLGISGAFFEHGQGAGSPMFFTVLVGLAFVVVGYGMYQPAAYAGVKAFTNKKTAAIGFAMIYAVMNLGAFFSGIISPPVRQATSMTGVYWVFVVITVLAFLAVLVILTRRVADAARKEVEQDNQRFDADEAGQSAVDDGEAADGEESDEPGEVPAREAADRLPPRPVLEPQAMIFALAVVGGLGGFLYQTITAAKPPLAQAVSAHSDSAGKLWKVVKTGAAPASKKPQPAAPGVTRLMGDYQRSRDSLQLVLAAAPGQARGRPGVASGRIEPQVFTIASQRFDRDLELLRALARGSSQALRMPRLSPSRTRQVRDVLRHHAVTTMAAAYGMAVPVDSAIVDSLRRRMKEIDEQIIPMAPAQVQQVARLASLPPAAMLTALGRSIQRTIQSVRVLLPGQEGLALVAGLSAERDYALSLARRLGAGGAAAPMGPVSRQLLQKMFMADSSAALDQARLLIAAVRQPNIIERMTRGLTDLLMSLSGSGQQQQKKTPPSFASVKIGSVLAAHGELAKLLPAALPLTIGARIQRWLKRFGLFLLPALLFAVLLIRRLLQLRPEHPFHDRRFTFFIFVLVPVQTLFAHNWLTLPYYINRVFAGSALGDNFEFFSNLNPILIFILTPLIAALTARSDAYKMIIWGTLVMATPTFLLALPPAPALLIAYIVLMTVGEAMWQPRFLQIIAEIAPEGKTGAYMGIGQFPWFLTKLITGMYSGWFIATYVPRVGPQDSQMMWLLYAFIAMLSPVLLVLAKKWMGAYLEQRHS